MIHGLQLVCSKAVMSFRDRLVTKYNLRPYRSPLSPTVFNGLYHREDYIRVTEHHGKAVVVWCGTDARSRAALHADTFQHFPSDTTHIAKSKDVLRSLAEIGVKAIHHPITPTMPTPRPEPLGNSVYIYGTGPKYGINMLDTIRQAIPHPVIHMDPSRGTIPNEAMQDIYRQCFMGLRLTQHDGLPNTVLELGLMGRPCVFNGEIPGCFQWTTAQDVVDAIMSFDPATHNVKAHAANIARWMKGEPFVTVMVNSYKEEKGTFTTALKSIMAQRDVRLQVLVCTPVGDPCVPWAKAMGAEVVEVEKPGIFEQLNAMAQHIKGDFVTYASSNDTMDPDKCIREVQAMDAGHVVYSPYRMTSTSTRKVVRFHPYDHDRHLSHNFVSDCAMVRASTFKEFMPFDLSAKNHAYHDLWLRIAAKYGPSAFIYHDQPTWTYFRDPNSQSMRRKKDPEWMARNEAERQAMLSKYR